MRSKVGATLQGEFSLNINACGVDVNSEHMSVDGYGPTFLKQDALQEGVFIPQHETFISGSTVTLLEILQSLFMVLNGSLKLLDVFGSTFTEGSLCLTIPLFALFRGRINLNA